MTADIVIFITLHYCTILLSHSSYCALDLYGLLTTHYKFVHLNIIALIPTPIPW